MEMCEDMVVDLNVGNMRKRQCMEAVTDHPLSKRTCQGLEKFVNANGILQNDCEMVYWQAEVTPYVKEPIKQHCVPLRNPQFASPQICPRCIAGESGHINHIMQL